MMRIVSLRASDGGGAIRIDIKHDNEDKSEVYFILSSHFREHGFTRGECSEETLALIRHLDEVCRGVKCGRRILGYGANSASALRMKLIGKGICSDCIDEILAILFDEAGLDEARDAMRLCELQLERGIGARRIISYLRGRGYTDESLADVREYLAELDFGDICRDALLKKFGSLPEDIDRRKKCIDYLLRRGFSYSDIKKAMEA